MISSARASDALVIRFVRTLISSREEITLLDLEFHLGQDSMKVLKTPYLLSLRFREGERR
jgi:hypothetical protein